MSFIVSAQGLYKTFSFLSVLKRMLWDTASFNCVCFVLIYGRTVEINHSKISDCATCLLIRVTHKGILNKKPVIHTLIAMSRLDLSLSIVFIRLFLTCTRTMCAGNWHNPGPLVWEAEALPLKHCLQKARYVKVIQLYILIGTQAIYNINHALSKLAVKLTYS